MDYLFFDIECSEGKSICSFGYVLTDSVFNVIEKKDILINPQSIFHTGPWSKKAQEKDEGITLAYPVEEFKSQPPFPAFYDIIKEIVTRKNTRVVGFSLDNDARFINYACKRYGMPFINFDFYDVQRIYQGIHELKDQVALEKVMAALGVEIPDDFVQHKSSDDAHLTLLITDALCKAEGKSLEEFAVIYPRTTGHSKDYVPRDKKKYGKRRPNNGQKGTNDAKIGTKYGDNAVKSQYGNNHKSAQYHHNNNSKNTHKNGVKSEQNKQG